MAKETKQQSAQPVVKEESLTKAESFIIKNRKAVIGAVVAVLVIIAGIICYNSFYAGPREEKASTAISKAQALYAQGQFDQALKGANGTEGFLAVASNYSGTKAANLANLYAGLCYAQLGKWNDAVKYLDEFDTEDDAMISPASQAALGNAYANAGQVDKAIESLKKAASMADAQSEGGVNNSVSPAALIQAGRLLESQGKKEEALKLYQEVKEKYINSQSSQDIDKYIERLSE